MKKGMLGILLAMMLVFANVVPVAATAETEPLEDETVVLDGAEENSNVVSEDTDVQAAYDAYVKMVEAMDVNAYGPMKDYYDEFNAITGGLTDEQSEEWNRVVETYVGLETFLDNSVTVATIIYTVELEEVYQADPNAKTAYEFVTYYDICIEYGVNMAAMVPEIESVYETAKTVDMPSENVVKVYDAYVVLSDALSFAWYDEDFINACEKFETILDIFNELTKAELDNLADLIGLEDGSAAWSKVFTDWANANMILQIGEARVAFEENPNTETAQAYVEAYESVIYDAGFFTDEDKAVIFSFFSEDSYEYAKTYLTGDEGSTGNEESTEGVEDKEPSEDRESSPKTGDASNVMISLTALMASVAVAAVVLKRRKAA